MNVHDRDAADLVAEARLAVANEAKLPDGVFIEWTGQFEHAARARRTLTLVVPIVVALIFLVLYLTYHDLADATLMMLAVPGAIAGGVFFQSLLGLKLSVTVWVGYIACFGMATSTGIIMLVYLREAVAKAGGLERIDLDALRLAVLNGAVHRLRPKLLTEGTVVIGLAPMLWSSGVASEIIRPMAAPVLGGILVADEVIDLFLPVLFYWVRRRRWERLHAVPEVVQEASHPQQITQFPIVRERERLDKPWSNYIKRAFSLDAGRSPAAVRDRSRPDRPADNELKAFPHGYDREFARVRRREPLPAPPRGSSLATVRFPSRPDRRRLGGPTHAVS